MDMGKSSISAVIFMSLVPLVWSHAKMLEPPMRSSMWRFGFNTPANYNDGELNCGGFMNQWFVNNGRCGVCGDPFEGPRLNEAGNKYGTGTIARSYNKGDAIKVKVHITANHKGYFEFRLCTHNNVRVPAPESCFDNHLLYITETGDTKYSVANHGVGQLTMTIQLPADVICSHCVLRWKYRTGNSWGCEEDGTCGLGRGKQEEFYNCADISITDTGDATTQPLTSTQSPMTSDSVDASTTTSGLPRSSTITKTSEKPPLSTSTIPITDMGAATTLPLTSTRSLTTSESVDARTTTTESSRSSRSTTTSEKPQLSTSTIKTPTTQECPRGKLSCVGVEPFNRREDGEWCNLNCNFVPKYCPESYCKCVCTA